MNDETKKVDRLEAVAEATDSMPPKTATLFERIIWVRNRVTRLGKDSQVSTGGQGSYKAISHDKVTAFIRPKMCQAGIVSFLSCLDASDVETGAVTAKNRKIVQHRATFEVTFLNAYDKDDKWTSRQYGYADDYGDKAPGKAASYAMKYALLKTFMIETGEEDEERVESDGGRAGVIADDDSMMADIWAVADECFGDDAKKYLKAMAERRFFVPSYGEIPQDRFNDAVRSLRVKKQSEEKTDE
jgi:hypothetical protein